jgi:O-antigen ligase
MVATDTFKVTRNEAANLLRSRAFGVTTEGIFLVLFVCGLAWVPYWLGSNRPIAWGINAVVFPGLAALYELSLLVRGVPHPVPIRRVGPSAVLFALAGTWAVVQNVAWTPSGWQHPIWQLASAALGQHVAGSISIDRDLTALALLRLMTAASTFWLALQLSRNAGRARLLIWCLVGISALYAAIGLYAVAFMPNGRVFAEFGSTKFISSTFVNQNHYVTFAGMGFIAGVAALLRLYRQEFGRTGSLLRLKVATLISTTGSKAAVPLAFACVILAALLLTGNRGGIIATAFGLFALCILNMRREGSGWNEALLVVFAALLVGTAFIGFGDVFVGRVTTQGLYDAGRLWVQGLTIESILSAPLLGFGYGTFAVTFPMFRDDGMSILGLWDKAHNTYLEIFQGLGLLFGGMLIACVIILVWDCLKGARTRKHGATIPALAASVSFLVGVQALVDFSLQIQAVTLTYMAILGAGVAQASDPTPASDAHLGVEKSSQHYSRTKDPDR